MIQRIAANIRTVFLALLMPAMLVAQPARAQGVENLMWPQHVEALSDAAAELSGLIALHLDTSDDAKAMWNLFNAPSAPLPDRLSLEGGWQVRSLQVRQGAVNIYDYFPCVLRREGPSGLVLDKSRGSQKRIGLILGDDSEDAFLFLGGSYTTGEPPRGYSGFEVDDVNAAGADAGIDMSNDSVGFVRSLGRNHLLIVFAPVNGRSEMYELKR